MNSSLVSNRQQPKIPGHSGCVIEFIYDGGSELPFLVKKLSTDRSYLSRMQKQVEKQQKFKNINRLPYISTPQILSEYIGKDEGHMIMEYLPSLDFIEYFSTCHVEEIFSFAKSIQDVIEQNIHHSKFQNMDRGLLEAKVLDLSNKVNSHPLLKNEWKTTLTDILQKELQASSDYGQIPVGMCHGDLTLSNILFNTNDGPLILIDFLDSFIESPIQDMVKVRQDTYYHWSLQLTNREYDRIRIQTVLECLDKQFDLSFSKYDFYQEWYPFFQILNFVRIIPYVKKMGIMTFILQTVFALGGTSR